MTPRVAARAVLHVGLPKTGTTYLQAVLAHHRESLGAAGVLYPFVKPQAMFFGAVEVRGSHEKFGLSEADVAGTWGALADRVRSHAGTSVISHEILGGAEPAEIAAALAPLDGLDVEVVITARDLGRQATAHWQEEVKLGDARSFADFEREQFLADSQSTGGARGRFRPHFWHAQDYAAALRRWSGDLSPDRVHLVVCPPPGAAPDVLWRRFADACGIPPGVVDPGAIAPANTSLTIEAIATLRALNVALAGQLTPREHARFVKRDLAEGRLAGLPGTMPSSPAGLGDVLVPAARAWRAEVEATGYPAHGHLGDLEPVLGGAGDPHPDAVPAGVPDLGWVAELTDEVLRLARDQRLHSAHDGTGNVGSPSGAPRPARDSVWRRLGLRSRRSDDA